MQMDVKQSFWLPVIHIPIPYVAAIATPSTSVKCILQSWILQPLHSHFRSGTHKESKKGVKLCCVVNSKPEKASPFVSTCRKRTQFVVNHSNEPSFPCACSISPHSSKWDKILMNFFASSSFLIAQRANFQRWGFLPKQACADPS